MSLLLGIVEKDPSGYEPCVEKVIELLSKVPSPSPSFAEGSSHPGGGRVRQIVLEKEYPRDYVYYNVPNPWLQVKLLRFLRYSPATLKKVSLRPTPPPLQGLGTATWLN